jgi:hypothetical protein
MSATDQQFITDARAEEPAPWEVTAEAPPADSLPWVAEPATDAEPERRQWKRSLFHAGPGMDPAVAVYVFVDEALLAQLEAGDPDAAREVAKRYGS